MTEFANQVLRVLKIKNPELSELTLETPLSADSLGLTELCILAEEHFNHPLTFSDAKSYLTYGDFLKAVAK